MRIIIQHDDYGHMLKMITRNIKIIYYMVALLVISGLTLLFIYLPNYTYVKKKDIYFKGFPSVVLTFQIAQSYFKALKWPDLPQYSQRNPSNEVHLNFKPNTFATINKSIDKASALNKEKTFIAQHHMTKGANNYTKSVEVVWKEQHYKAKVKIHGVWYHNFVGPKKSLTLKFSKKNHPIGLRKVSLNFVGKQAIGAILSNNIAQRWGILNGGGVIGRVYINSEYQGAYFIENLVDQTFLEFNKRPLVDEFSFNERWDTTYQQHVNPLTETASNFSYANFSKKNVGQVEIFQQLLNTTDKPEEMKKLVNLEKFAKVDAIRILFGSFKSIKGDNLKFLFDTTNSQFEPYFRTEGHVNIINVSQNKHDINKTMYIESFDLDGVKIYRTLSRLKSYRDLRDYYLMELVKDKERIIKEYDKLVTKYSDILSSETKEPFYLNKEGHELRLTQDRNTIIKNLNFLKKYLSYSHVQGLGTIYKEGNRNIVILKALVSSYSDNVFEFNKNCIEKINYFYAKKNLIKGNFKYTVTPAYENIPVKVETKFLIKNNSCIENLSENIKIINLKTNKVAPFLLSITHKQNFDLLSKYELKPSSKSVLGIYLNKKSKEVIFDGLITIDENIVTPIGYSTTFTSGTEIKIAPNKSLVIQGNLRLNGLISAVHVRPLSDKPFGVFAVLGNGKTKVNINGLVIEGGSEAFFRGIHFSGQLSLYHHKKVVIQNSSINNSMSDDGLNIKYGNVIINNNTFANNFSDQVDLDFVSGEVKNNSFFIKHSIGKTDKFSSNGDGLDLSGSEVIISNNTFDGFRDKAISKGESTKVKIENNTIKNSFSAIVIKDGSDVRVRKNELINNVSNIRSYVKKRPLVCLI